jgi:hypothetical protein
VLGFYHLVLWPFLQMFLTNSTVIFHTIHLASKKALFEERNSIIIVEFTNNIEGSAQYQI